MSKEITIGEISREYGEAYITRNRIKGQEKGLIRLLSACRTNALGNHFEQCTHCSYTTKAYDSCRNRHCPACQQKDKMQWLDKRMTELLPVGYYHLVFTIPHELNLLCLKNKKVMYGILFKAASQTLLELTRDTKHLGADIGLITVLHTWGQNMMELPHLHCIMPQGGLGFDKTHWVHLNNKNDFFIHYKVLSRKSRGKFLDLRQQALREGQLEFKGKLTKIAGKKSFRNFIDKLYKKDWVVNIQSPLGNPGKVLEYLSRYISRIAITNRRIMELKDGKVLFSWKDYRSGLSRKMRLEIDEFIRRFLLHILPKGFFKVRSYGIFANRYRRENMETAKKLLHSELMDAKLEAIEDGSTVMVKQETVWQEIKESIKNFKKPNCPKCNKGQLRFAGIVPYNYRIPG
jgi:NAD-dependent SIR2 family protein deacetylase